MDYVLLVLELLGGVGLFLYGMSLMGSSLEKLAGGSLEKILEKLTTGKSKRTGQIMGENIVWSRLVHLKIYKSRYPMMGICFFFANFASRKPE